jgi:ubiquinone/menaquinone biosynthesis C-methylase UbiE
MRVSFDRAADYYDKTRTFPLDVMNRVVEILHDELKDCRLILDAGVGTGRFAGPLQKEGLEVVGVDISPKMLRKSVEKKLKDLMLADTLHLPFKDKAFDVAMSVHMLHLVSEWRKALREIARVTRSSLFSVLVEKHGPNEVTPRCVYDEELKKLGYGYRHPGLGEWDLEEKVKPKRSIFASSYEMSTDEDIACLEGRVFSSQWRVTDDLHEKALQRVKEEFPTSRSFSDRVYVYEWDVGTISNFLEAEQEGK